MHKGYLYLKTKKLLIENMCGVHKKTPNVNMNLYHNLSNVENVHH
jgi:hypothetical protein